MKFFNNFDFKPINVLKIAGLVVVAIIVVALAVRLIGSSFKSTSSFKAGISSWLPQSAPDFTAEEMYYGKGEISYDSVAGGVSLSVRNAITSTSAPTDSGIITGADAEEFEVTEYNANIETRHLADTCNKITDLKSREDVIFENANEFEHSCNYNFKVKRDIVAEILAIIETLNPKELNENTYTIKRLIDDYTGEVKILKKKMESIEETLANAIDAYDDITNLATRTQDVESLAKIIDSKIKIIERLTQERININAQLERLERAKAEQLDRLDYTYFNVYIAENKFIDGQNLKDSWKLAIKSFVRDINGVVQDMTINLVALLLVVLQYIVYLFIVLIIVKYCWRAAKYVWKK